MDWYAQAIEVLDQLQLVSWSKGEQEEDFGEKSVEVCHEHHAFQQPKEEKLKHKILLDSNFKETERNHNNIIIRH